MSVKGSQKENRSLWRNDLHGRRGSRIALPIGPMAGVEQGCSDGLAPGFWGSAHVRYS